MEQNLSSVFLLCIVLSLAPPRAVSSHREGEHECSCAFPRVLPGSLMVFIQYLLNCTVTSDHNGYHISCLLSDTTFH